MLKFLGLLFLSLIISTSLVVVDSFLPGSFLNNFMNGDFIQTFATVFGFNIAAVIFLLGQLFTIERAGQDNFKNTKQEMKDNAYYLLISFALTIILLTIRPDFIKDALTFKSNLFYYAINISVLTLFIIALYAIFEILEAAFGIVKK